MAIQLSRDCTELLARQGNVIARSQGGGAGLTMEQMRNAVRYGQWQHLQRGVYAPFTGEPGRESQLWAAILRAGEWATLSHQTAAEWHGLLISPSEFIHITVPAGRNPAKRTRIEGVVIHRSDSVYRTRHPVLTPPCTRIEDTVLDLITTSRTIEEAYGWITRAVGSRRTTAERILAALALRTRLRWRRDIELALGEADRGAHSWLELRYVRGVERSHGLPRARRRVRTRQATGTIYLDNLYEEYGVCVELDGTAAHPASEQWRDKRRDNYNLVREDILTLRFGFLDLRDRNRQCQTAAMVADLLRTRGLVSAPTARPCQSPQCALSRAI
jgi:very-short-patch-repair endonuclease